MTTTSLGLGAGATPDRTRRTVRGIVSIVGPVGATLVFEGLGHGVPFLLAAAIVAVAGPLAVREGRAGPRGGPPRPPLSPHFQTPPFSSRGRGPPPAPRPPLGRRGHH